MEDNPFVTDLGDPNRPQKLAEKFNGLYDNSWTDAFEALSAKKKDEKSICLDLLKVLQVIIGNWKMSTFSVFIVIKG